MAFVLTNNTPEKEYKSARFPFFVVRVWHTTEALPRILQDLLLRIRHVYVKLRRIRTQHAESVRRTPILDVIDITSPKPHKVNNNSNETVDILDKTLIWNLMGHFPRISVTRSSDVDDWMLGKNLCRTRWSSNAPVPCQKSPSPSKSCMHETLYTSHTAALVLRYSHSLTTNLTHTPRKKSTRKPCFFSFLNVCAPCLHVRISNHLSPLQLQ